MSNHLYILDESGQPEPCENVLKWGQWMESGKRRIAETQVGNARVSTVFLGIDHSFGSTVSTTPLFTSIVQKIVESAFEEDK